MIKSLLALLFFANTAVAAVVVEIGWRFEQSYRDVLERYVSITDSWADVPGPYPLTPDRSRYLIILHPEESHNMYRVRRNWGVPWLLPDGITTTNQ